MAATPDQTTPPVQGIYSKPTGLFTDEDFIKAAKEVQNPDFSGWEFVVESMGVKMYRRYLEESGLYEYKTHGIMEDMDPEICAMVYLDWDYRSKWDTYVLKLHPIKEESTGMEGLYWAVDYPWPMSDRDYCFIREGRMVEVDGEKTWVVLARSQEFPSYKEKSNFVRVDDFKQSCAMQSDGKVGSKAFMHYYDNPKGYIPAWLINWACQTGVPHFMDLMKKAVANYKQYLEENGKLGLIDEAKKFWVVQQHDAQ